MIDNSSIRVPEIPTNNMSFPRQILFVLLIIFVFPLGVIVMWLWLKKWPFSAKLLISVLPLITIILGFQLISFMAHFETQRRTIDLEDKIKQYEAIIKAASQRTTTQSTNQQNLPLDDLVTYDTPKGWTKSSKYPLTAGSDPSKVIFLRSPDYATDEHVGYIVSGAEISIQRSSKTTTGSLQDEITSSNYNPYGNVTTPIVPIKIDGNDGLNRFYCGEFSCRDFFFVERDGFIWNFNFQCAPNCSNKSEADKNQYAKDRDTLLSSIKFK